MVATQPWQSRKPNAIDRMSSAFNDAVVANWESMKGTFGLSDVDDEHVVAAALVGGADVIATSNVKDFPPEQPEEDTFVPRIGWVPKRH